MTCAECRELVGELIDGTLAPDRRADVQAHVGVCAACRLLEEDFAAIRRAAAGLERPAPPDGLWMQIAGRIKSDPAFKGRTAARPPSWTMGARWLAAAATLVVVVVALAWMVFRGQGPGGGQEQPGRQAPPATRQSDVASGGDAQLVESVESELRLAEGHYEKAIAGLEKIAKANERTLDPQVAATLQKNLTVIDQAIAESRAALGSQPESRPAQESLFEALRRKVSLLQDTIVLMNEMRKGDQAGAARIVEGLNKS